MTHPLVTAATRRRSECDYPSEICGPCGEKHGQRACNPVATWTPGVCECCGKDADVTEPRDYGHLKPTWNAQEAHEG